MVGELFVLFLVPLELLFLPTAQSAIYLFFVPVFKFVFALDHADIGIVLNDLCIDGIGVAPAKRQVINRIQQIGLTHAVVAHKTGTSATQNGVTAATNDAGIVTLPNGKHYAISVFVSDSKEDEATNEKIIADISKKVWDYFIKRK